MAKKYINGYALALLAIALEENKLLEMKNNAKIFIQVIYQNELIFDLFTKRSISTEIMMQIIRTTFKKFDLDFFHFINLIFEKRKIYLFVPILKKFVFLINQKLQIKEGIIYTTNKLSANEIKAIELQVSQIWNFKPELTNKLDSLLLGGFKAVVNDKVIEDSAQSRLSNIKHELLKGENYD